MFRLLLRCSIDGRVFMQYLEDCFGLDSQFPVHMSNTILCIYQPLLLVDFLMQ